VIGIIINIIKIIWDAKECNIAASLFNPSKIKEGNISSMVQNAIVHIAPRNKPYHPSLKKVQRLL